MAYERLAADDVGRKPQWGHHHRGSAARWERRSPV